MDNHDILAKMHQVHLSLADELRRICEKYDIKYFMLAGTLLGAIRHKGFIPWDDDMDFGMFRPDFEKFLKVADHELNKEKYYLQTDRKEKYYTFNFVKIRLNGTKVLEDFSSHVDVNQGIYIDIFPLDSISDNRLEALIQYDFFWYYRNLLWVKCGYGSKQRESKISFKIARILSHFYSIGTLKKCKNKIITKYMGKQTKKVVTSDGNYGLKKETIDADLMNEIIMYKFEDREYPGFRDYDRYLSYFYGDYMKLPPIEKRNHHGRLEIDFGLYQ